MWSRSLNHPGQDGMVLEVIKSMEKQDRISPWGAGPVFWIQIFLVMFFFVRLVLVLSFGRYFSCTCLSRLFSAFGSPSSQMIPGPYGARLTII